ncbi:tyrosine-protein phosphatase [Carnobacterium maltaromaticum]|uniref:tyrosine-protein phosphatase n=1 Tax=Carnobacterium maltaromaticum TaxID=2751 RepID=UPI0010720376|nr:tyrosine-protein phosphatase [Carnobacterium maltaromaticum]TFJ72116.1 hypothetical protein CKN94_13060 [Carnobacterium maltaromaticum]TFJ77029.1 hypothetical protein CKN97_13050 [Carnobacterium maltaromaticum]
MEKLLVTRENQQLDITIPKLSTSKSWLYYDYEGEVNLARPHLGKCEVSSGEVLFFDKKLDTQRLYFFLEDREKKYIGAERRVNITSLYNCRDLGGYKTSDNQMVKWGKVFRSDALHELSQKDELYLEEMRIKTLIDFRSPVEIAKYPNQFVSKFSSLNFNPHADVAQQASTQSISKKDEEKIRQLEDLVSTTEGKEQLKKNRTIMVKQMMDLALEKNAVLAYQAFFKTLLTKDTVPMIFHCQGGKDRTGWAAALFLAVLGVPKSTIYKDYLVTEELNAPRNKKRMDIYQSYTDNADVLAFLASMQETRVSYLDGAFHAVEENYGEMSTYLKQVLQLSDDQIQFLKSKFLY